MRFSGFTRFGFLRFSGDKPEPQKFYEALGAQLDVAFDTTPGLPQSEDNEAEKFATAMHLARISVTLKKAFNQRDVTLATDLLPLRELDYLAQPGPFDTIYTRGQRLLAIKQQALGATQSNLAGALALALAIPGGGSDFIKLRPAAPSDFVFTQPTGVFPTPTIIPKFLQLTFPVAVTGTVFASYGNLDTTIPTVNQLAIGDVVTVQGESMSQGEVVTVLAVQTLADGTLQFQATFTKAHEQGATVTTMPFPRWQSTQAFLYVEVGQTAAKDPIRRGKVDAVMAQMARGVTQWAIVSTSGGNIGPFTLNVSPLGTATVGTVPA